MTKIILHNIDASRTIEIVRALRESGMVHGQDFDFAYYQSTWDNMIGEIPRHVEFKFYVAKSATMFALKYAS